MSEKNEWQVASGAGRSSGRNSTAKKPLNLSEDTTFSFLEGADESMALQTSSRPKSSKKADSKNKQPLTKAQKRMKENAAFARPRKAPGLDRRNIVNGEFTGETVSFAATEKEKPKTSADQNRKKAAAEKERKKAVKKEEAAKKPKSEPTEQFSVEEKKPKKKKTTTLTAGDVSKIIDTIKRSNTEPRYMLLAVWQEIRPPKKITNPAEAQEAIANWVYGMDDDDVLAFFKVFVESLALEGIHRDKIGDSERAFFAAFASGKTNILAKALVERREELGKNRGFMSYAALFMELLAEHSPSFARFAWMKYADTAVKNAKNSELLCRTADSLIDMNVKKEEPQEDACAALFDEEEMISSISSVFEMATRSDKPSLELCKKMSSLLDLRVLYPEDNMISSSSCESLLTGLEEHLDNDVYRSLACGALVQALALPSNKAFNMLVDELLDYPQGVTSVILNIATTRAVDWLPQKPLQQFVSKVSNKANQIDDDEKKNACLDAVKELTLTMEDPERNKPVIKTEDEQVKEEEENVEDDEDNEDEENDEDDEDDEDDDDDDEDEEEEEEEEEELINGLKRAPKDDGSKCLIIYAIVVAVLAFVIAGIGAFFMLHCDEYPQCLKLVDFVCPRIRPICENYKIPYNPAGNN